MKAGSSRKKHRDGPRFFRLFGHWEDVKIQGTDRSYLLYAYHPLDFLLTDSLLLAVWAVLFLPFLRSHRPDSTGILIRGIGIIYLPKNPEPFVRLFLAWMAIPMIFCVIPHVIYHNRQRRILRGELISRQGILSEISYSQHYSRGGTVRHYRFLLKVPKPHGKFNHEVYELTERQVEEFGGGQIPRACRVELALLPPKNPNKRKYMGLSGKYVNMLHMRVEKIFCLETLNAHCKPVRDLLFYPEQKRNPKKTRK